LKKKQIDFLENILKHKIKKKLCSKCGNYQSHSLIYCSTCGSEFTGIELTLFDQFRIGKNRIMKEIDVMVSPYFIAKIWSSELEKNNITVNEFIDYLEIKYGFYEKEFRNGK
jgi:hypothetical protein